MSSQNEDSTEDPTLPVDFDGRYDKLSKYMIRV